MRLQRSPSVNAIQWAVGLGCCCSSTIRGVYLTTDHPNGGGFWRYPEILRLLMDVEFRKGEVRKLPAEAEPHQCCRRRSSVPSPTWPLLHLRVRPAPRPEGAPGRQADGDVTIYPEQPNAEGVMFSYPRYVLKAGQVVVEEGQIRALSGSEFIVHPVDPGSNSSSARSFRRSTCPKTTRRKWRGSHLKCPVHTARSRPRRCPRSRRDHAHPEGTGRAGPARSGSAVSRHGRHAHNDAICALPVYLEQNSAASTTSSPLTARPTSWRFVRS